LPAGAVGAGLTQQGHEVVIEAGAGESAGDQRDCAAADAVEHATICGIAVIQTSPCGSCSSHTPPAAARSPPCHAQAGEGVRVEMTQLLFWLIVLAAGRARRARGGPRGRRGPR
jgi:hypothetical protein